MKSKQIMFFATQSDIEPILKLIESSFRLLYHQSGLFETNVTASYSSIFDVAGYGISTYGNWNREMCLLVTPIATNLITRDIPQRAGGIKFAVDQLANPLSCSMVLGGVYKEGILIGGNFATVHKNEFSDSLYHSFSSSIKKNFKRIGSFYVGEQAEDYLRCGWRLTTNVNSPKVYDLVHN